MPTKKKILLTDDVDCLGHSGDIATVARGYANYLIVQKKALLANKASIRRRDRLKQERVERKAKELAEEEVLLNKLEGVSITIPVKADQDQNMYGSVSLQDVWRILVDMGFDIAKKSIIIPKAIKEIGEFSIPIKFGQLSTNIQLKVVVEEEEEEV